MKIDLIGVNRHPAGRHWNFAFGLAALLDGLVRVGSLGFLHTRAPVEVARLQTLAMLRRAKRRVSGCA